MAQFIRIRNELSKKDNEQLIIFVDGLAADKRHARRHTPKHAGTFYETFAMLFLENNQVF
jgi:hypothetical protein